MTKKEFELALAALIAGALHLGLTEGTICKVLYKAIDSAGELDGTEADRPLTELEKQNGGLRV